MGGSKKNRSVVRRVLGRLRMRARALSVTIVIGLSLLAPAETPAATGKTPGSFNVSIDGAAVYTVPIAVPPGPRGVHPTLELKYNSKGGNGIMGVGWTLAGLTSIERCGRTEAQDGISETIVMSAEDRFCLGGNRLRMIEGTTYGGAGTVYEMEITDYSRITAYAGTLTDGPQYFIVQAKNGWTYEYGRTEDSRVIPLETTAVLRWKLNKVSDRSGNNYVITYLNDPNSHTSGHAIPESISWAPSTAGGSTYTYTLYFSYELRDTADWQNGWVAGSPVFNRQRLTDITIKSRAYGAETTIKKYNFTYQLGPVTKRSRLKTITECADDQGTTCLSPTTLSYQAGYLGVTQGTGSTPPGGADVAGRYDFNGDGRDDLYFEEGGTRRVALSVGNGFAPAINTGISTAAPVVLDRFSVPNRDDILANVNGALTLYRLNSAQSAFVATGININYPSGKIPVAADTTGDGLAELAWVGSFGTIYIRRNTTSGDGLVSFEAEQVAAQIRGSTSDGGTYEGGTLYADQIPGFGLSRFDINGDGRQDLYIDVVVNYPMNGSLRSAILQSYGTRLLVPPFSTWGQKAQSTALFFNDDRCTDRLRGNVVYVSKCRNLEATTVTLPGTATPAQLADWDGDGRTDVLINNGGTIGVYRSDGTGFMSLLSSNIPISAGDKFIVFDQDGDGLDDLARLNGGALSYYTHTLTGSYTVSYATNVPDLLSTIEDGYGNQIDIDYASTAVSNYLKVEDAPSSESLRDLPRGDLVVGRVIFDDGAGGQFSKAYTYVDARYDAYRKTRVGFRQREEVDSRTGFVRRLTFEQLFPLVGSIKKDELLQPDATTPISISELNWVPNPISTEQHNERYFPYVSRSSDVRREVDIGGTRNGYEMTTVTTVYSDLDDYGNFGEVKTTITDQAPGSATFDKSWATTATYAYQPDTGSWCLGLPENVHVVRAADNGDTVTQTTNFDIDYTKCRIKQSIVQPQTPYEVTTGIRYDDDSGEAAPDFGQPIRITVTGVGMTDRVRRIAWNATGQFPESVTIEIKTPVERAHDETTTFTYDLNLGTLESMTDPNGAITTWGYDDFGRPSSVIRPDRSSTIWTYEDCGSGCLTPQHKITVAEQVRDAAGGSIGDIRTYLDRFGRPLALRTRLLGSSYRWDEVRYDALGLVSRSSIPCLGTDSASCVLQWIQFSYDETGRVESVSHPTLQSSGYTYQGRKVSFVDAEGSASIKMFDPNGWLRRSEDANGYAQEFSYDAAGSLRSVVDENGKTLFSATYDYGIDVFQRTSFDPGSVNLVDYPNLTHPYHQQQYNALGDLIGWTDPKGQSFSATYDELSRPLVRMEPDNTVTYQWGYRPQNHELGRVQQIESTLGGTYRETYEYDTLGRPWKTTITIPGEGNYTYESSYHATTQLLDTLKYPTSTGNCNFTIKFGYQDGILNRLTDASSASTCGSTGGVLWQATAMNAFGALTREELGNDLITQHVYDLLSGQLEQIKTGTSGNETLIQSLGYLFDNVGNLTLREDSNLTLTERFYYRNGNDQLHRLESTTLTPAGQAPVVNLRQTYDEPAHHGFGTIRTRTVQEGADDVPLEQSISWTSFNYPSQIESNGETAAFSYGPDRQRWRMSFTRGGNTETTYYIGGLMEKVTSGGVTNFRHLIPAGTTLALLSRKSTGSNTFNYLLFDHQGSVQAITSSSGTPATTLYSSFSAYGSRRSAETWSGAPSPSEREALDAITRQGYTYQTALGSMGLNHMNGRVQDALTGTFLSPDPFVADPGYTQSFNRYSYVNNNPLTFTDPSGFTPCRSLDPTTTVSIVNSGETWSPASPPPIKLRDYYPDNTYPSSPAKDGSLLANHGGQHIWDTPTSISTPQSGQYGPCPGETNPSYAPQYGKQGVSNIGDSTVGGTGHVSGYLCWRAGYCEPMEPVSPEQAMVQTLAVGSIVAAPILFADPLFASLFALGSAPTSLSDGMPVQLRLFRNRYPLDPIDIPRIVPTSQLSRISGNFNYVITQDGRLIVGRSAHTSLTGGAQVRAAGEVQLFNGRIKWIDNASGHYRPTGVQLGPLVEGAFNSIGLDATGKFILRAF